MSSSNVEHPSKRKKLTAAEKASTTSSTPNFSEPDVLVTFLIGPEEIVFRIHKEFVCFHSEVLKAAFSSSFIEGQTQTYKLVDTSLGVFKMFAQWVYGAKLNIKQLKSVSLPVFQEFELEDPDYLVNEDMMLVELWVLADKFNVPKLQNKVIEIIIQIRRLLNWCRTVFNYIYEHTALHSPLRKLAIHHYALLPVVELTESAEFFPHAMLTDYAIHVAMVRAKEIEAVHSPLKPSDYFVPVEAKS